jgi:hypothetical protein
MLFEDTLLKYLTSIDWKRWFGPAKDISGIGSALCTSAEMARCHIQGHIHIATLPQSVDSLQIRSTYRTFPWFLVNRASNRTVTVQRESASGS